MIVRNCQFCFVEIDWPSKYQNRDGSILCKECFDAGHTVPKDERKDDMSSDMYSCDGCENYFHELDLRKDKDSNLLCAKCSRAFDAGRVPAKAQTTQPDNSHYTKGGIEPWTYIQANNLNFFEGSVVKYITRWRHKNGIEDLCKARVYIDELIRQEEEK